MKNKVILAGFLAVTFAGALMLPMKNEAQSFTRTEGFPMDFGAISDKRPSRPIPLLFVHHSVGGQLLADPGDSVDLADSIHRTHPNGGGLRKALESAGYLIHEASYGSEVGEDTDLFDWYPKFQNQMPKLLRTSFNDQLLTDDKVNEIILFKSCYPNNRFQAMGQAPGNAAGPELTVWNAKATLSALLPEFQKHPSTLFVYFTSPPNAPNLGTSMLGKRLIKKLLGKPSDAEVIAEQARLARIFTSWTVASDGWLKDYPLKNVVAFDFYDVLTDHGASNLSRYPTEGGTDSHPARAGQQKAAAAFVPFLNRAVRRAGLSE